MRYCQYQSYCRKSTHQNFFKYIYKNNDHSNIWCKVLILIIIFNDYKEEVADFGFYDDGNDSKSDNDYGDNDCGDDDDDDIEY